MPALTPRVIHRNIRQSKLARGVGASYGFQIAIGTDPVSDHLMGKGMESYGTGLTTFGGELMTMLDGSGLYPFGSGIMTMGTGLVPFGMGFLSKLKGFAKKATSVITGSTPAQLKRAALDAGKKKARELLPKVISKVKSEIESQAPGMVARITGPLVGKLPTAMQGEFGALVKKGLDKGLAKIDSGLSMGEARAQEMLSGSGIERYAFGSQGPLMIDRRQLDFMRRAGQHEDAVRSAGDIPKRLVMDQQSQSLAETILANKRYKQVKQQELAHMLGLSGGSSLGYHSDFPSANDLETIRLPASPRKKAAGRPKGTGTRGKGIVYLK